MFLRLRLRLTLVNAAGVLLVVLLLTGGVLLVMDRVLVDGEAAALDARMARVAQGLGDHPGDLNHAVAEAFAPGYFSVLWGSDGSILFNPSSVPTSNLKSPMSAALRGQPGSHEVSIAGDPALVDSRVITSAGQPLAVIQIGTSLSPVRRLEGAVALVMGGVAAIGLLASLGLGWLLAGRSLVPIQRAFDRQRAFAADASHELRTPLAVVDASIQVLRRHPEQTIDANAEVLDSAATEVDRMRRLVEDLLTLARADSGQLELQLGVADVDAIAGRVAGDLAHLAEQRQHRLSLEAAGSGTAVVDADRVRQLLLILVDNALTHTPAGTSVRIATRRRGDQVLIEVADDGPGIPEAERTRALERFRRVGEDRGSGGGAGLGLAIARWLVEAHGGRIRLLDNEPGLRVEVTLPGRGPAGAPRQVAGPAPA